MKAKFVIPIVFLAAIGGFEIGWKVGRKSDAMVAAANPMRGSVPSLSNGHPANVEAIPTVTSNEFLTLPDVERALNEVAGLTGAERWQRLQAIAARIESADIPAVLAKLAAPPARADNLFCGLLLQRWGAFAPPMRKGWSPEARYQPRPVRPELLAAFLPHGRHAGVSLQRRRVGIKVTQRAKGHAQARASARRRQADRETIRLRDVQQKRAGFIVEERKSFAQGFQPKPGS